MIVCETVYVNDTLKMIDQCIDDGGEWSDQECVCSRGEEYSSGTPCERAASTGGTTTTTGPTLIDSGDGEVSAGVQEFISNNLVIIIGVIAAGVVAYFLLIKKGKKKIKKAKKIRIQK